MLRSNLSLRFRILVVMGSISHRNAVGIIGTLFVQIIELITLKSLSLVINIYSLSWYKLSD